MRCPKTPSPAETLRPGSSRMRRRMQPEAVPCRGLWTRRGRDLGTSLQVSPQKRRGAGQIARSHARGSAITLEPREPGCRLLRRAQGSTSVRSGGVRRRARQNAAGRRHRSTERLGPRSDRPPVGTSWSRPRSCARRTTSNSIPPSRSAGPPRRHHGNREEPRICCCRPPPIQDRASGHRRICPRRKYEAPDRMRSLIFAQQVLGTLVGNVCPLSMHFAQRVSSSAPRPAGPGSKPDDGEQRSTPAQPARPSVPLKAAPVPPPHAPCTRAH